MDERLKHFKVLIDSRSFTDAAKTLHISQPALSTSINKLEKELQATLIYRGPTLFEITPAGHLVYEFAAERSARTRELIDSIGRAKHQRSDLRIGMIDSIAGIFCDHPTLLPDLEHRYRLSLTVDNSAKLIEAVRRLEIDYALVVGRDESSLPKMLTQTTIADEPLLNVSAWPNQKQDSRLISYNKGSTTYEVVRNAFAELSITKFQPEIYSTSPETMLRLVRIGRGHAVLPYSLIKQEVDAKKLSLYPIGRDGYARRPISIVYRRHHESITILQEQLGSALKSQLDAADYLVEPLFYD